MPTTILPAITKSTKTCPISREQFAAHAKPLTVAINGQQLPLHAQHKEFGTTSIGWSCKSKITLVVDSIQVPCWVFLNVTAIGSKELPPEAQTRATTQPVENEKQNGDLAPEQRDRQRFWNKCLRKMGEKNQYCRAAVSMYHDQFHAPPKGLRYVPDQTQLDLPVREFISHWNIL